MPMLSVECFSCHNMFAFTGLGRARRFGRDKMGRLYSDNDRGNRVRRSFHF